MYVCLSAVENGRVRRHAGVRCHCESLSGGEIFIPASRIGVYLHFPHVYLGNLTHGIPCETMNVCRAIRFYMRFVKEVRSTQWLLY
jgi:hypothetical protein